MTDQTPGADDPGEDATGSAERRAPRAPMGGHMASWPFAVAFAVAALLVGGVIAVNVFAGGGTTGSRQQGTGLTASGAVACPEFFEHPDTPWVPARPAGVHPRNHLVPKLHPTHVTVCAYTFRTDGPGSSLRLSGEHELGGRLDDVVDSLRSVAVRSTSSYSCVGGGLSSRNYLIGLRYAEAIVWVSASGACNASSNGARYSHHDLSTAAAASYAARRWVGTP